MNNDLNELINQLDQLHLERQEINQREQQLLRDLRQAQRAQAPNAPPPPPANNPRNPPLYRVGDLVYITNRLGPAQVFGRRINGGDRGGTVTRFTPNNNRVYLTTFNGYETWRQVRNVRRITQAEADQLRQQGQ